MLLILHVEILIPCIPNAFDRYKKEISQSKERKKHILQWTFTLGILNEKKAENDILHFQ